MYTYLALGDSYTIGEQVPPTDNFPHQIVELLKQQQIEVAAPKIIATTGWTTDELLAAIADHNITDTFTFVTLLIGVNNQYRGRSVDNFIEEFRELLYKAIAFACGKKENVLVLSIPDWGATPFAEGKDSIQIAREIDEFNGVVSYMSQFNGCQYIEITESTRGNANNPAYLAGDGLHPSGLEYAVWAGRVVEKILRMFK